jgi:O-antigen ligase
VHRNWFAICALSLIVVSDYKFRVRSPSETLSGALDITVVFEVAVYGLVGGYLILSRRHPPRIRRLPLPLALACAYVALLFFSLVRVPYPPLATVRALEELVVLLLALTAYSRATRADLHRFAHGFLALVGVSVVFGLVVHMPPATSIQEGRFTWLRLYPVVAGVFLGLATLIALAYVLAYSSERPGPHWRRRTYLVLLALVAGGLAASQTRGAVLGAVVGALVLVCFFYRAQVRLEVAAGLILAVAFVAAAFGDQILAYFQRGESAAELATLNSRTELWSLAATAFQQHPVFGWGLGASRGIFLSDIGLGGGHNALVNVAVDLGAVGVLVWGALVLSLFVATCRLPGRGPHSVRVDRAMLLAMLTFLVVDGFFYEGVGAVANVAGTSLLVLTAWVSLLVRDVRAAARAATPVLR